MPGLTTTIIKKCQYRTPPLYRKTNPLRLSQKSLYLNTNYDYFRPVGLACDHIPSNKARIIATKAGESITSTDGSLPYEKR